MARKKSTNYLISLWSGMRNVAVISTTDEEFLELIKQCAQKKGYRIEESDSDEG